MLDMSFAFAQLTGETMISGTDLFLGLFNNLAIFIVLAAGYGYLHGYFENRPKVLRAVCMGIVFGLAAIACMHIRIPVADGVIVDQRNAVVVLSGAFGGPIAAILSGATAAAYRAYLGGAGVISGVVGVGLAAISGILLGLLRRMKPGIFAYASGSFVATAIILPGFVLFKDFNTGFRLMLDMALPYGAAIFVGIFFVGLLLIREEHLHAAEVELMESEKKFRDLYEGLIDVSFRTGQDGRIVHISPSSEQIIGFQPQSLVGRPIIELYRHPEEYGRLVELIDKEGRVEGFESEMIKRDGSFIWVSTNAKALADKNGAHAGIEGIARDITKQKRAEQEKLLLEESLQQSQKMEALGTLAGGIAHDFNNILGAILGYTEMVMESLSKDDADREHLQAVLSAAQRASELTQQILMFSRKGKPDKRRTRIQSVVEETVKLLNKTIPATVQIKLDIDPSTGSVLADATQMHQVIMNLCTNAFHALPNETGVIRIKLDTEQIGDAHPELRAGRYARLLIEDNGKGIDPALLPRIFEPFFTTKAKGTGTGLGLSVVHGIIADHGGAVRVDSKPGQGTVFRVFLPSIDAEEAETPPEAAPPRRGNERVLLVDDEQPLATLWKRVLENQGYRVVAAVSARQALELFCASMNDFDLIITDQTMPEMSGDALAMEAMRLRSDIPVIICTGHSAVMDNDRAEKMGVRAFLMKPMSAGQLTSAVRTVLDQAGQKPIPEAHTSMP